MKFNVDWNGFLNATGFEIDTANEKLREKQYECNEKSRQCLKERRMLG